MAEYNKGCAVHNRGILASFKTYLSRSRLGEILVTKKLITTKELRFALKQQKETQKPLGQVFMQHSMISRRQLAYILCRQYALRCVAAFVFFAASLTLSTNKKARADLVKDVPAQIKLVSSSGAKFYAKMSSYPALFGTDEKRSGNIAPFTKWTGMFDRFDRELKNSSSRSVIENWQKDLESFKGQSLKAMAKDVNEFVNKTKYIVDSKNWGKSDYWATPVEFLKRGSGDCEDFAIVKYTALRALGVPEERLRLAIVHDNYKNIPHAVLIVYTDEGSYILDNQVKTLASADRPGRYRPIFSINRHAWWLHTAPETTIIASAE